MLQAVNCSTRSILSLALGYPRPASCPRKACKNQLKVASASVAIPPRAADKGHSHRNWRIEMTTRDRPKSRRHRLFCCSFMCLKCNKSVAKMLPRHQQCSSNGSNLPTACLPREGWTRQNIAANLHRWWYHVQSMKRHHQKKTPHWVLASFFRNKSQLFLFEILCSLEILPEKVMDLRR